MAADWVAIRLAYVNGSMSLRELADAHGIKSAGVMRRAANEGWEAQRKQKASEVSAAAQARINETRPNELAKFNEDDLKMARAIRGMVAKRLNASATSAPLTPGEIAQLAAAAERAQKIGRLALGANTDSHAHTGEHGGPIGVAAVPVDEYLKARQKVLDEF